MGIVSSLRKIQFIIIRYFGGVEIFNYFLPGNGWEKETLRAQGSQSQFRNETFFEGKKYVLFAKICARHSIFPKEEIIFAFTFEKSSLP